MVCYGVEGEKGKREVAVWDVGNKREAGRYEVGQYGLEGITEILDSEHALVVVGGDFKVVEMEGGGVVQEVRKDELKTTSQAAKTARARTSVQYAPPLLPLF